jgi:ER membrane protein complex subunit 2
MAPSLLHPPSQLSPAAAMQLAQQAPIVLQSSPSRISSNPLLALLSASETPDLWLTYENLLLSCLRTGDEATAHQCLERLVSRFGDNNERIMALKGLTQEAAAVDNKGLETVLREYDGILKENDTNIVSLPRTMVCLEDTAKAQVLTRD